MNRPRLDPASAKIRRHVTAALTPERTYIVAVSGGADSMSMAAACAFLLTRGYRFHAVTVDHGLQSHSAEVAAATAATLISLGLPATVRRVQVEKTAAGVEADARTARYAALDAAMAEHCAHGILLAHTRNDQAETVLLGLMRGSGARSLSGMRVHNGPYVRPLLGITREETEAATRAQGIDVWDDPMNVDPSFTRVRVRKELIPAFERVLGGGVVANLARTAEMLAMDSDALESMTHAGDYIRGRVLLGHAKDLVPAIRTRVVRDWLWQFAPADEAGYYHVKAVDELLTGKRTGAVSCPPGSEVVRLGTGDLQMVRLDGLNPIYR